MSVQHEKDIAGLGCLVFNVGFAASVGVGTASQKNLYQFRVIK